MESVRDRQRRLLAKTLPQQFGCDNNVLTMAEATEKPTVRVHVSMAGSMFNAMRKRMPAVGFGPKAVSAYIQALIRADVYRKDK